MIAKVLHHGFKKEQLASLVISVKNTPSVLGILSGIIGVLVSLVISSFIVLTDYLSWLFFAQQKNYALILLLPIAASLLVGICLVKCFKTAGGSGEPETIEAFSQSKKSLGIKEAVEKYLLSTVSLSSGISLGREYPSIKIGSAVASALGRNIGLQRKYLKIMIALGAVAGLTTAFNAPITAVIYVLSQIVKNLYYRYVVAIITCAIAADITTRLVLGSKPLFYVPNFSINHNSELVLYMILGVAGSMIAYIFEKLQFGISNFLAQQPNWNKMFFPVIGGISVGLIGLITTKVLGGGYDTIDEALKGVLSIKTLALLLVLKIIASSMCAATGNVGGLFAPSLFIGAMFGGVFGLIAKMAFPEVITDPACYAVVGMGVLFLGITKMPLVSFVMILEITGNYTVLLPLAIANLIAFTVLNKLGLNQKLFW